MQLKKIIYTCTAAILLVPAPIFGADEEPLPWKITADRITHEEQPEKIIAEGNVHLEQYEENLPTGFVIQADRILYNIDENLVHGTGNLRFFEKENEVRASDGRINLADQVGIFDDASIFWRENNLFVTADQIEKTDENTYLFQNGKVTSCTVNNDKKPDWSIWSKDVNISLEEYATLKHATFRVKDVPVFYLPYFRFPIGSTKKSGFLFPEYSSTDRNGSGLIAPFFINLSPSYDITLYPGYYEDRGVVAGGEFRYAAGPNSRGTFMFNYLDDDLEDTPANDFKSDGILRTNSSRYWFRGKADHDFGNRLVTKLDLDIVSDRDYLQEFKKGIIGFDQSNSDFLKVYKRSFQAETIDHRENTLQVSKVWTTTDLQGEIRIIDDVRDDPDEDTPPWALPRIGYSGLLPFMQTPLDLVWGTEYVYFWRDEGIGGHRVNLHPRLNGPLSFSPYLESSYQVGVRETLYFLEPNDAESEALYEDDFESRTMFDFMLTGATTLSRDYELSSEKYKSFRHTVRPELSYLLVQGSGQSDLPVLDNEDRVTEIDWLKFNLNNYFRAIRPDETSLFQSNHSTLKIEQVYDIDADDHPFSDIYLEFIFRGIQDLFFKYETSVSMYGKGVTSYSLESQYNNNRGFIVDLDYRYKRNPGVYRPYFYSDDPGESLSELKTNLESRLSELFSVKFNQIYSFSSNNTVESTFSLAYHNPCWTLEFAAKRTPDDTGYYLYFSLEGISSTLGFDLPEF